MFALSLRLLTSLGSTVSMEVERMRSAWAVSIVLVLPGVLGSGEPRGVAAVELPRERCPGKNAG